MMTYQRNEAPEPMAGEQSKGPALPELPAPGIWVREDFGIGDVTIHEGFTADQMREYAEAAVNAACSLGLARDWSDAERYRWLRNASLAQWAHPIVVSQERVGDHMRYVGPLMGKPLDAAIDSAMKGEQG